MAYLRWSHSNWYVYKHVDGGDLDDAVLMCMHGLHRFVLSAGELRVQVDRSNAAGLRGLLRARMEGQELSEGDWLEIDEAIRQFLKDVYLAGKLRMPSDVAERYLALRAMLSRKSNEGLAAWAEICDINDAFPPPDLPSSVRQLKQQRALRLLSGEVIPPEQDADEVAAIEVAQLRIDMWPAIPDDGCSQS